MLVLHGLEGCSRSGYVMEACRRLRDRGLRPVALNFRGRSGEPNRTRRLYHSGETDDLAHVLTRLRRGNPGVDLGAVGFSLGGNVLLKYMGERPDRENPLSAAACVSVPFDLAASARHLERGAGRIYASSLLRSLKRSLRRKVRLRGRAGYDLEGAEAATTLREFDEAVTAPVHGFADAAEYYRLCSSRRFLAGVGTPTLALQAEDDPFVPAASVPRAALARNPQVRARLVERGGHVGFVAGRRPWRPEFWAEEATSAFLAARLEVSAAADARGRPGRTGRRP